MRRFTLLGICASSIVVGAVAAEAQTGTMYQFQADTLKGTVWILGQNARRELESGENRLAAGRIKIWRDGGREIFLLDPAARTYYEAYVYRAKPSRQT